MEEEKKICTKCNRELPLSAFNKMSKSSDGYQHWCRDCQKESAKARVDRVNALLNDPNNKLASFKPRELIDELRRRGYSGKLKYVYEIEV